MTKGMKCYYCNLPIKDNKFCEKKMPLVCQDGKTRNYRRIFHLDCLNEYLEKYNDANLRRTENDDWGKVYACFRKMLGYKEDIPLDKHAVMRLAGLRLGQYYPNGTNTRILKRGYDYHTILLTLKLVDANYGATIKNTKFNNQDHKVNYIMKFVQSNIAHVYASIQESKLGNELNKITPVKIYEENNNRYLPPKKEKDTIVLDILNSFLSGGDNN